MFNEHLFGMALKNINAAHLLRILSKSLLLVSLCFFLTACTASFTTLIDEEVVTNQKPMSTYRNLIISDFELNRELFTSADESGMSDRERQYSQMPSLLSEHIERYVKSRHIYQSVSRKSAPASLNTLLLKGKFTKLGRFRISIVATLYDSVTGQEVAYLRQTLWDIYDSTEAFSQLGSDVAAFIDKIQYK